MIPRVDVFKTRFDDCFLKFSLTHFNRGGLKKVPKKTFGLIQSMTTGFKI